jgi:hypothetical protein
MTAKPSPAAEPAVRYYLFLGLSGLLLLGLAMFEQVGPYGLAPAGIGALGLAGPMRPRGLLGLKRKKSARRGAAPLMVILTTVFLLTYAGWLYMGVSGAFDGSDLMIATGLLAYLAAQYRIDGLVVGAMPLDPRRHVDRVAGDVPETRPARLVDSREWYGLAMRIPACIVGAQLVWFAVIRSGTWRTPDGDMRFNLVLTAWRFLVVAVGFGLLILVTTIVAGALRWYTYSPDEANIVVRDAYWEETRGEQRRISRWTAWLRRRRAKQTHSGGMT